MQEKCSNAFTKHVDPIFVIQNNLLRYTHKTGKDSITQISLSSKKDEQLLLSGICYRLINQIEDKLTFKNTQNRYKQEILNLCKQDLSYQDFQLKKKKADKILLNHAKLKYLSENYFNNHQFGNETYMAGLLISVFANICNKLKQTNNTEKIPSVRNSKLYYYIKEANLEQGIDITKFSNYSFSKLAEIIFNHMIDHQYETENSVVQPMLVTKYAPGKNRIGVEEYFADIFVISDDTPDYNNYKKSIEQEVYNFLVDEVHKLDNGMTF